MKKHHQSRLKTQRADLKAKRGRRKKDSNEGDLCCLLSFFFLSTEHKLVNSVKSSATKQSSTLYSLPKKDRGTAKKGDGGQRRTSFARHHASRLMSMRADNYAIIRLFLLVYIYDINGIMERQQSLNIYEILTDEEEIELSGCIGLKDVSFGTSSLGMSFSCQ